MAEPVYASGYIYGQTPSVAAGITGPVSADSAGWHWPVAELPNSQRSAWRDWPYLLEGDDGLRQVQAVRRRCENREHGRARPHRELVDACEATNNCVSSWAPTACAGANAARHGCGKIVRNSALIGIMQGKSTHCCGRRQSPCHIKSHGARW